MPVEPFEIVFDTGIESHLTAIDRKFHGLIRREISEQLRYQADVETKKRKRLREPAAFGAAWEIRFGPDNRFRVLYRVRTPGGGLGHRNQTEPSSQNWRAGDSAMKTTTATKLRAELASYLARNEPVVVTQHGRMKAILVPVTSEADAERWSMANNAELFRLLDAASQRVQKTGGIPHDEFWKRIDPKYAKKSSGHNQRKSGK